MGKNNKQKVSQSSNNLVKPYINKTIDKQIVKQAIIEAYKEIDKENNKMNITTEALKLPMDAMFFIIVFIFGFLALVFLVTAFYIPIANGWNIKNIITLIISITFFMVCSLFCILFWKTRVEISKESNKNYIVAYFTAIVSFIALIATIINYLK